MAQPMTRPPSNFVLTSAAPPLVPARFCACPSSFRTVQPLSARERARRAQGAYCSRDVPTLLERLLKLALPV
eukprot:4762958-Pleurochrysis_carterae.AAC.1